MHLYKRQDLSTTCFRNQDRQNGRQPYDLWRRKPNNMASGIKKGGPETQKTGKKKAAV
jgi:hypothetical protein